MIIDGLFAAIIALNRTVVDAIPTAALPITGWGPAAADVIHGIGAFNTVLPVEAALVCATASVVYLFGSTVYQVVMWIIRKVPFAGIS